MLRFIISIVSICFIIFPITAQQVKTEAVNPDFIYYLKQLKQGAINEYGFMPASVRPNFNEAKSKSLAEFPTKYNMIDSGWVTTVKDQKRCGSCWNFTTLAAIESNWLKTGLGNFDLSEQNMRTCQKYYNTTYYGTCNAGNHLKAAGYLFSQLGPVNEADDAYNTDKTAECVEDLPKVAYLPEMILLPNDRDIIKQAIIDHGGVFTSMYMDESLLNSGSTYLCSEFGKQVNHAVLLVGWDDTKVILNKTGTWIAKNSWGTNWGDDGYFYLSFRDRYALTDNAVFPSTKNVNHYQKVYMYDEVGWISNTGFSSDTAFALVKYTTTGRQKIVDVGTYVNTSNTQLEFEIYLRKERNILGAKVSELKNIICEHPGHYTFALTDTVSLLSNTDFYVKVRYMTPDYNFPIPTEKTLEYYSEPELEINKGWISSKGEFWTNLRGDDSLNSNNQIDLTVKAYAIADTSTSPSTEIKTYLGPNPSVESVQVEFENLNPEDITLELINTRGEVVFKNTFSNSNTHFSYSIKVSHLYSGIYYLRITNGDFVDEQKVVVIK